MKEIDQQIAEDQIKAMQAQQQQQLMNPPQPQAEAEEAPKK